ncbi:MAG: superoxide dismutase family protein [Candidatus Andeanibacterium colombiense]|uniref:Superoxide dismutase family protein n=1 Tax=Candidatus Andeanibacterium colombiense TaxID=3121345 RepID=A0AAJ5X359_9SPHN|nr:MAG: superoxide dismutase family protein [Sphingomonadaceae bacterium]
MIRTATPILIAAALAGCQTTANQPSAPLGRAVLYFADGRPAGTAQLLAEGDSVAVAVELSSLPAGIHAVHLHTTGKCEAPGFTSAGGHLNPAMHQHGKDNPMGAHLGDMPNVEAGADGGASFKTVLTGAKDTVLGQIYDADGTAIVVHEKADDYRTDPTGNAGSRIACGVFEAH